MKHRLFSFLILLLIVSNGFSQPFKFAFVSDTHIGASTGEEDLKRTVSDINLQTDLDFVILTGDITEMGTDLELALAKKILGELKVPFYIIPGNHDTGWSESGGVSFIREFGYDKFVFDHKGYRFIGCASGPYVRMSDGHIPRDAVVWLDSVLAATPKDQPLVFANHYPLDNGLDNWYDAIDRIKKFNTQFAISGHLHTNKAWDFEGIPATTGRSNLRAKAEIGGYNIVEMRGDSALFSERNPGKEGVRTWRKIALGKRTYDDNIRYERPSFDINQKYPVATAKWIYHSDANVVSTPAYAAGNVIFGNSVGTIEALAIKDGSSRWTFKTNGAIYSSPAVSGNKIVLGSGDGYIYCLNAKNGRLIWKLKADAAVLGAPVIEKGVVYIGGSDHNFRAISLNSGKQLWAFKGLEGSVVSKPLLYGSNVIFGAWDRHLYSLNKRDGSINWKWNNGAANRMLSPAMVNPVASRGIIYIAAPDRYLTAIDASSGKTLWRTNVATVRESIGLSEDQKLVYGKTMNDYIVAFRTGATQPAEEWRLNAGFGYEHVPSMLIERAGIVYFGTKSGVVYAIDPKAQRIAWAHKIDNSMVNTVNVIAPGKVIVATMDGKVTLIEAGK